MKACLIGKTNKSVRKSLCYETCTKHELKLVLEKVSHLFRYTENCICVCILKTISVT
jgi:hypothetical protein